MTLRANTLGRLASPVVMLALMSCMSCRGGEATPHDRDLILQWLACDECTDGELSAVVDSVGATVARSLLAEALLRTPEAAAENIRAALGAEWARVGGVPADSAAWVTRFTANYVSTMQRRAAIGLGVLGDTATLRIALANPPAIGMRDDVRRGIAEQLAAARGPGFAPEAVARVVTRPDSFRIAPGDTARLEAIALGAAGNMLSRPVTWTSSDTLVAFVDTLAPGRWAVMGRTPGYAALTATADIVSGHSGVIVAPQAAVTQHIAILSGDHQTGAVAMPLDSFLVVRVTDSGGTELAGAVVEWIVRQGGANAPVASQVTDASGVAAYKPVLGPTPGPVTITARLRDTPGQSVRFIVRARS